MNNNISNEMIEQAKKAESAEELLALAKENNVVLTAERAQKLFNQWHTTHELSDDELDSVSGGCGGENTQNRCPKCKNPSIKIYQKSDSEFERKCTLCGFSTTTPYGN